MLMKTGRISKMRLQKVNIKKVHNKKKQKREKGRLSLAMYLLPSLSGVSIFFILPFFVVIYYSLIDNPVSGEFVFLDNFINVFNNGAFRQAAYNTFMFSVTAVPLAVILSLGLAMLLDHKIPYRSQFRTFFLTPMMVPIASIVLIFQVMFHYNGAINDVIKIFGIGKIDWFKSSYSQIVIVILFLWKNLGYNMILFMAALGSIPRDIIEVAELESATPWQIFIHIKVRYLSSTFLFVTILSLINSFKVFREIYLLTGDHPYETLYMLQHFMNNMFSSMDYQKLSSAAILMSIVMIIIIAVLFITENYFGKDMEE